MKILHTADWHLGKRLEHFSRLEEQKEVLNEICQIAEENEVDAVLIAGDLFDLPNPSIEAIETFYHYLKKLADNGKRAVIGIAGNHDSPDRIEAPDPLARECGIILLGYPHSQVQPFQLESGLSILRSDEGFIELNLPKVTSPLRLILTPYANEVRLRRYLGKQDQEENLRQVLEDHWKKLADKYFDDQGVNILMTHLFVSDSAQPDEGLEDSEEKSILSLGGAQAIYPSNFPKNLQYVALGHIHSYIKLQNEAFPIIYSSSPLCYSVSDRQKEKNVVLIEAEAGKKVSHQKIPLSKGRPTIQHKCHGMEEAIGWLKDHPNHLVELTLVTDHHLGAADNKRLLDSHAGILRIIPEFTNPDLLKFTSGKKIDLSKSVEELFEDYFEYKLQHKPGEELKALFKEILNASTDS